MGFENMPPGPETIAGNIRAATEIFRRSAERVEAVTQWVKEMDGCLQKASLAELASLCADAPEMVEAIIDLRTRVTKLGLSALAMLKKAQMNRGES